MRPTRIDDEYDATDGYSVALAEAVTARLLTGDGSGGGLSFRVPDFEAPYDGPLTPWTDHLDAVEADCFAEIADDTPDDATIRASACCSVSHGSAAVTTWKPSAACLLRRWSGHSPPGHTRGCFVCGAGSRRPSRRRDW